MKIGSAESPEGKVFLEHMPWSVISGAAPRERGLSAMDSVASHLASPHGTHLCWPSYTQVDDTIGYVTRVYPGVKENGAIFSHPNAWPIIAETMLGRGEGRAMAYYDALAPSNSNDAADVRGAEPYVYAQFLYGRVISGTARRESLAHRHRGLDVHRGDEVHPGRAARLRRARRCRPLHPRRLAGLLGHPSVAGERPTGSRCLAGRRRRGRESRRGGRAGALPRCSTRSRRTLRRPASARRASIEWSWPSGLEALMSSSPGEADRPDGGLTHHQDDLLRR